MRTHHFEAIFACREWVIGISSFSAILTYRRTNCLDQLRLAERFEINRSALHRPY
jgi:hypothetical protein